MTCRRASDLSRKVWRSCRPTPASSIRFWSRFRRTWKAWKLPGTSPRAYSVWVDERDKVWLTDFTANAIVRFDPKTETFESFPSSARSASVRQMAGRSGEAWGAESGADRLVVVRY